MKRILTGALAALFSALTFGATLNPVQLLNPTGSSAGQAIVSTGPTTAPLWGGVPLSGVTGTLAVNHGGTGASSASGTALDNITGFASTGFVKRTGAGAYSFIADPLPIANGGTGSSSGALSATTITASSTITPSQTNGIVGTTTNNNANAGSVGEYVSSTVGSGSPVSATTNVAVNVTSISLTAGDWDVSGVVGVVPAGSTVVQSVQGGISTTSATQPSLALGSGFFMPGLAQAGTGVAGALSPFRETLSGTTTIFLVCTTSFTVSTNGCYGTIRARRIR